ncbi:MAG: putative Ig domain-containing protein [Planctomycetota bacterium]|jgi:parallel beta-helix repeat protein
MKTLFSALTILLVFALGAVTTQGATYYVATNGSDSNPGTSSQPWLTLQHAVDTISSGDTILVSSGTYDGCRIRYSGSSGSPKTLKAQTAGAVLIDSPGSTNRRSSGIELQHDDYESAVDYWTIDGFEVADCSGWGIDAINASHLTVKNCEVHENGVGNNRTGIFSAWGDYVLIENNVSYSNGEHGIYVNNSADDGILRGNTCYSNTSLGVHMNGDAEMGGDGIMSDWLIEKNVCYSNGSNGFDADGVDYSTWRNNLAYGNTSKGLHMTAVNGTCNPRYDKIYNNTFICESSAFVPLNFYEYDSEKPGGNNNEVKNNILFHYNSSKACLMMVSDWFTNFESDYNVVTNRFGIDDGASYYTLSQWRSTYSQDQNSTLETTDTDIWVDPSNDDYHLKSGSTAIDAGTTISSITDDLDDVSRPQGSAYDCGCYEYESGYADLEITTTSLPDGTVSVSYSQTLAATGGKTPYSWSIISGSLPSGLSLTSSTGNISGTPTSSGTSNFTVQVTDDQSPADSDTQALSITINTGGQTEKTYQQGLNGYTGWDDSWITEDLPNDNHGDWASTHLQYYTQDRQLHEFDISDIPSSATVDEALLKVYVYQVDSGTPQISAYRLLKSWVESEVTYNKADSSTNWASAGLQSGTDYASSASATSSSISSTGWATLDITDLVQDWVDGTYTNYGVLLRLTTSGHIRTRMAEYTTSSDRPKLEVTYTSGAPDPVEVTTTSLPDGQEGVSYSQTLAATGGETPYSWSVISGSLPSGLSLGSSTGTISGTPTSYGTSNFTVRVTDDQSPADTDDQALSITVDPEDLEITTTSLPDGQQDVSYSQAVSATGGDMPYTWSIDSGSLPAGLSLGSSTGTISGTPTSYGTSNFTVKVTDDWSPANTDTQALSITVAPTDVNITTTSLPGGTVDVSYSQTVSATGGDTPYTWSIDSGSLPPGLSLGSSTGTISGTPTTSGNYNFTVKVTDDWSPANTDTQALSITVAATDVNITTTSLPDGTVNVSYSQTVSATGGETPYSWSIISGSLPSGVSLNSSTGNISGTPTAYGTSNFTVRVTDDQSPADTDDQALSIYVAPADLSVTTTSLPDGTVNVSYSQTLAATGGETPYSWSVISGSLPSGLSLTSSTGNISGTPTSSGTSNFTVRVTDDQSPADTDDQALSITINTGGQTEKTYQQGLDGYTGWDDSWITEDNPNDNFGDYIWTHLQYSTQDRQLHEFDISDIPSSATVDEALLKIYVHEIQSGTPQISAYRLLKSWVESEVTYNKKDSSTNWASPGLQSGTDYASSASATSSSVTSAGWATLDITDLVQDWVDGTYTNRGVLLRLITSGHLKTRMSEYSTSSVRPKLEVTYTSGGYDPVEVTTTSLPNGAYDVSYSQTLAATGGLTPYSWSVISGSLPSGLSLNSSTGNISGTPTASGTSNFTVRVTDDQSPADTDDQALSITVTSTQQEETYQQGLDGYTGWDDSWITEDLPNDNHGDWASTHLQYYTQDRQLHEFDVSDIPSTATVDEALLKVYVHQIDSGTPQISAYRLLKSWVESEVTYNKADTSTNWASAGLQSGTDYASSASATSSSVTSTGWVTLDITDLVQDWVDGTYTNNGALLRLTTAGHIRTRMAEYTTSSNRPKLEVKYTP